MFSANTEFWRPYFEGSGLPVDFVLDWIEVESGGNPCNLETSTGQDEVSILQLMVPDNTNVAETTEDALRSMCVPGSSHASRELTSDDIAVHVDASITYVEALRAQAHSLLQNVGSDWSESSVDFWSLVKLIHSLPSLTQYLQTAANALGHGPSSWDEFTSYVPSTPKNNHWLTVSANVGAYAAGFQPPASTWLLVAIALAGLAFGVWMYERRAHRRIGMST